MQDMLPQLRATVTAISQHLGYEQPLPVPQCAALTRLALLQLGRSFT